MSRYNLRNTENDGDDVVDIVKDVDEVEDNGLMNLDLVERMVDKFGEKIKSDIGAIVESLKLDLLAELKRRDVRITDLESEVIFLRDSLARTNVKSSSLEKDVADMAVAIDSLKAAPPSSASANDLPYIDLVIAGDSIVKHLDIDSLPGSNKLICLPGARAHKVHVAVKKLVRTANVKKLVLHFGTNNIPYQTPMQICQELSDSLKQIQLELPESEISLSAILPKIGVQYNRGINFINNYMFELCNELGMGFIQHTTFCEGQLNKKLYAPNEWRDGRAIHPSHEGALLMMTNIKLHILK
jgi:hypothetical protein